MDAVSSPLDLDVVSDTEPGGVAWPSGTRSNYSREQMLTIAMDAVIRADPAAVWKAWRPSFPMRPPEQESRNENVYDLAHGLKVPVTLVAVNEMRNWTIEHALPGGKLVIDHWMAPVADGAVRVGKRYEVHGPTSMVYRVFLARGIRTATLRAFATLEREASRSAAE